MTATSRVGTTVGHIRITDFIGAGGMGEVYLGYDETLRRTVAVKTIGKEAALHPTFKARFLREARALSQLDHPNICQIHDYLEGDESDFLVLEYIDGNNLGQAIRSGLDPALKLRIAEQIADVLVVAHEKGVIHRDIKPSNVMLTPAGQAKVLDFGLARFGGPNAGDGTSGADLRSVPTGPVEEGTPDAEQPTVGFDEVGHDTLQGLQNAAGSGESIRTVRGSVVGTPLYMSPEQARGEEATGASDMYSFGLLIRELFTGRGPLEQATESTEGAPRTGLLPGRSVERLTGELNALVERLESPVPSARPSAAETLERLRWIRDKPRRRNRNILIAIAAILIILAGLKYTFDLRQERSEAIAARNQAEELVGFLIDLFEVSDPGEARGRTITAREILGRGADEVTTQLDERPRIQAKLMETIGVVYTKLGLYDEAGALLEQSLDLRREVLDPEALELGDGLHSLAVLYNRKGLYREGEDLARHALAIREAGLEPDHIDIAEGLHTLGLVLFSQAKYLEAEESFRRAAAMREERLGPDHPDLADSLRALGMTFQIQARFEEAEPYYKRALAIQTESLGEDHPDLASTVNGLASVYESLGRYDEAESLYHQALEIRQTTLGPGHPDVAYCLINIAGIHIFQGRFEEAETAYLQAIEIQEGALGPDHPEVANSLSRIGSLYTHMQRPEEAEAYLRRAVAIIEADPESPRLALVLKDLASLLDELGQYAESEELITRAHEIWTSTSSVEAPEFAEICFGLGHMYHRHSGRPDEAAVLYRRAIEIWSRTRSDDDGYLIAVRTELADLLRHQGEEEEARAVEARIPSE